PLHAALPISPPITPTDRLRPQAVMRPNPLTPPFNNVKNRQALLYAVGDQKDYLAAIIGNPEYEKPCWAVLMCDTPFGTTAGVGPWATNTKEQNVARGK